MGIKKKELRALLGDKKPLSGIDLKGADFSALDLSGRDLSGLDLSDDVVTDLLSVDKDAWLAELAQQRQFFSKFDRLPAEISAQLDALDQRLRA